MTNLPLLEHRLVEIAAENVRSLAWDGDDLIDWVDGGARYGLDGRNTSANVEESQS